MFDVISTKDKAILLEDLNHIKTFANSDSFYYFKNDEMEVDFDMKYHMLKTGQREYVCAGIFHLLQDNYNINVTLTDKSIYYQRIKDKNVVFKCYITLTYFRGHTVFKIYPPQKTEYNAKDNHISTTNPEMLFIETLLDKSRRIAFFNNLTVNFSNAKEYENLKKHITSHNINELQNLFKKTPTLTGRYRLLEYIMFLFNIGLDPFNLSISDQQMIALQYDLKTIDL